MIQKHKHMKFQQQVPQCRPAKRCPPTKNPKALPGRRQALPVGSNTRQLGWYSSLTRPQGLLPPSRQQAAALLFSGQPTTPTETALRDREAENVSALQLPSREPNVLDTVVQPVDPLAAPSVVSETVDGSALCLESLAGATEMSEWEEVREDEEEDLADLSSLPDENSVGSVAVAEKGVEKETDANRSAVAEKGVEKETDANRSAVAEKGVEKETDANRSAEGGGSETTGPFDTSIEGAVQTRTGYGSGSFSFMWASCDLTDAVSTEKVEEHENVKKAENSGRHKEKVEEGGHVQQQQQQQLGGGALGLAASSWLLLPPSVASAIQEGRQEVSLSSSEDSGVISGPVVSEIVEGEGSGEEGFCLLSEKEEESPDFVGVRRGSPKKNEQGRVEEERLEISSVLQAGETSDDDGGEGRGSVVVVVSEGGDGEGDSEPGFEMLDLGSENEGLEGD
uniref:Uncharacterized protein n=1 Tax=Chromera velia CCMP2878 TaxID=1169474 RepID=A0A0G4HSM7_9ALVE|eukprot:Cvel_31008.t1-p1 / transcript=Cvel_31008.t1 / gene=Cvel_31008 / organism=Chromera_velia_CCMP2878 / gene_product=hypothetical protein / transcript_product=hypothetical protein / location=Cvel_scaffold4537:1790-3244(+) / protein_length=451 / sequence_SO=supercontig / SO=protein_coding / is_pseudo=false